MNFKLLHFWVIDILLYNEFKIKNVKAFIKIFIKIYYKHDDVIINKKSFIKTYFNNFT